MSLLGADAAGELPVHHLKPGGDGGGGAGEHLGHGPVGEHVKAERSLECCDINRELWSVSSDSSVM